MTAAPPQYVLECLECAGRGFYEHLIALGWPDANRDAPAKEANIVLHVARELMRADPAFHVYLEAAIPVSGRLDLLAANAELAVMLEAKCFGNIGKQAGKLSDDVNRMRKYFPQGAITKNGDTTVGWWNKAPSRWALAVVPSFRGDGYVSEAWRRGDASYLRDDKDRAGFDRLMGEIGSAYRDAFQIDDGKRWEDCGQVCLLVAALEV